MAYGLEIIAAGLLIADVGVYGGISRRAGKIFAFTEGDVLTFRVLVALGETKVDDIDVIFRSFTTTNQEIVWLDVTMDDSLLVHLLDTADHLSGDVEACFEVKLAATLLEEVFKTLA